MEPEEINEFSKQMEEGGESHLRAVSLIISVLAVFVAMVTVMGHRTHTEAVLVQSRVSDQWNQFQAKKIRQTQLQSESEILDDQPNGNQAKVDKTIAANQVHLDKLADDIQEEGDKARELEADVRVAERKASRYDLGEALLQIAVVLSSITLLTRQRFFVLLGLVLGACGLAIAATALFLH